MRGDKEWSFSGVTKSGRVWRKVPESGARSVRYIHSPKPSPTFPRYQYLPILTANRRVAEGKVGGRVLHCCHPRCPQSGTINIIIRAEGGNRKY